MARRKKRRGKPPGKSKGERLREIKAAYLLESGTKEWREAFDCDIDTETGIKYIDDRKTITHPAVWRCLDLIGNSVAKLPLNVEQLDSLGNYETDTDHFAQHLLHDRVSKSMWLTSPRWRKTSTNWAQIWGNGISYINRDRSTRGAGRPIELIPLLPDRTYLVLLDDNGLGQEEMVYTTYVKGELRRFRPEDIVHQRNTIALNVYWGGGLLEFARQEIGHGLAVRRFNCRFFGRGATSTGVLMAPTGLDDEEVKGFAESFAKAHEGLDASHRTIVLEDGAKYQPISVPARDAQLIESLELSNMQIALFCGVPPSNVGVRDSISYNSREMDKQDLLDNGVDPHLVDLEGELGQKVLTTQQYETGSHRVHFDRDAFMALDWKSLVDGTINLTNNGLLTENEGRRKINQPAFEDGDRRRMPLNIGYVGEEPLANDGTAMAGNASAILADALRRGVRKMSVRVRKAIRATDTYELLARDRAAAEDDFRNTIAPASMLAEQLLPEQLVNQTITAGIVGECWHLLESGLDLPHDEAVAQVTEFLETITASGFAESYAESFFQTEEQAA